MQHRWSWVKQQWAAYKSLFYTGFLVAVLAFFGRALYQNWQEIVAIRLSLSAWAGVAIATGITLFAFTWTGWVWGWILEDLGHPVSNVWATQIYLTTNIAKYLPSNLVHLYGRTLAATNVGIPLPAASLSVILDTLLMISAGLILGLLSVPNGGEWSALLGLIAVLLMMHPAILHCLVHRLTQLMGVIANNKQPKRTQVFPLKRYPWRPLLGEIGIVGLRGLGFAFTVQVLIPLEIEAVPRLISIFSIGWLVGFVTPGIPGGVGVFEYTVSQLMIRPGMLTDDQTISYGLALGSVALYRLMNTIAEAIGAGLAWLDAKQSSQSTLPIVRPKTIKKPFLQKMPKD